MTKTAAGMNEDLKHSIKNFKAAAKMHGPMDPEIKAKIVEALRNGDYAQTRGYLRLNKPVDDRPAGFCCLGVFSEVAMANGAVVTTTESESGIVKYFGGVDECGYQSKSTAFLVRGVADWLGWTDSSALDSSLMSINDNGASFAEIADLIEECL